MADAAGMRPHEMITGINLANTLLHAGQMDAAADVASSTLDIAQSLEHEPNAGSCMLALLLAAGSRVENALAARVWGWIDGRFRADQYILRTNIRCWPTCSTRPQTPRDAFGARDVRSGTYIRPVSSITMTTSTRMPMRPLG